MYVRIKGESGTIHNYYDKFIVRRRKIQIFTLPQHVILRLFMITWWLLKMEFQNFLQFGTYFLFNGVISMRISDWLSKEPYMCIYDNIRWWYWAVHRKIMHPFPCRCTWTSSIGQWCYMLSSSWTVFIWWIWRGVWIHRNWCHFQFTHFSFLVKKIAINL